MPVHRYNASSSSSSSSSQRIPPQLLRTKHQTYAAKWAWRENPIIDHERRVTRSRPACGAPAVVQNHPPLPESTVATRPPCPHTEITLPPAGTTFLALVTEHTENDNPAPDQSKHAASSTSRKRKRLNPLDIRSSSASPDAHVPHESSVEEQMTRMAVDWASSPHDESLLCGGHSMDEATSSVSHTLSSPSGSITLDDAADHAESDLSPTLPLSPWSRQTTTIDGMNEASPEMETHSSIPKPFPVPNQVRHTLHTASRRTRNAAWQFEPQNIPIPSLEELRLPLAVHDRLSSASVVSLEQIRTAFTVPLVLAADAKDP